MLLLSLVIASCVSASYYPYYSYSDPYYSYYGYLSGSSWAYYGYTSPYIDTTDFVEDLAAVQAAANNLMAVDPIQYVRKNNGEPKQQKDCSVCQSDWLDLTSNFTAAVSFYNSTYKTLINDGQNFNNAAIAVQPFLAPYLDPSTGRYDLKSATFDDATKQLIANFNSYMGQYQSDLPTFKWLNQTLTSVSYNFTGTGCYQKCPKIVTCALFPCQPSSSDDQSDGSDSDGSDDQGDG